MHCATQEQASVSAYEVTNETDTVYEELDVGDHFKMREEPRPPNSGYELDQCAAYRPVTTN